MYKGWNVGSGPFSVMANNHEMRKKFVKNSREFIQRHGFDGLDLEYFFFKLRKSFLNKLN